ncbi:hypothetical protein BHM03_00000517 [Ensete ventricosum]|nr:hypothetical protein BHM03_00000517 [Ensete ventricosum]
MVTPSEASRHGGSGLEEIWKRELGPSRPRFFARRVGGSEVSVFFDRTAPSLLQNPTVYLGTYHTEQCSVYRYRPKLQILDYTILGIEREQPKQFL